MNRKIGIVGLGYVGLPVAVAFGSIHEVVGFDINIKRIEALKNAIDETNEVSSDELKQTRIHFTSDPDQLSQCNFIIVAVPTPIDEAKIPDLTPLIKASETVGRVLSDQTIVVYESTVYPGATEEVCVPILEKYSNKKCGKDFFVGYSPERINPGDKNHVFTNITKVVSGQNDDVLNVVADVYGSVVRAGVFRAKSIKVAEAAKVIENTQRDLNIALMNELSIIFNSLGISTKDVIEAAGTKWNFIPFGPGLVGGHCIGVDPYYLTYKAESIGYHPQVILAGRRINDGMGKYVATELIKCMILENIPVQGSTVTLMGLTFKENVPDLRNSKVIDIINELRQFGVKLQVTDPLANKEYAFHEYGIQLIDEEELEPARAVILAVPHNKYRNAGWAGIQNKMTGNGVVVDVKSALNMNEKPESLKLWRL